MEAAHVAEDAEYHARVLRRGKPRRARRERLRAPCLDVRERGGPYSGKVPVHDHAAKELRGARERQEVPRVQHLADLRTRGSVLCETAATDEQRTLSNSSTGRRCSVEGEPRVVVDLVLAVARLFAGGPTVFDGVAVAADAFGGFVSFVRRGRRFMVERGGRRTRLGAGLCRGHAFEPAWFEPITRSTCPLLTLSASQVQRIFTMMYPETARNLYACMSKGKAATTCSAHPQVGSIAMHVL